MKYRAKPVVVDAFEIKQVGVIDDKGGLKLLFKEAPAVYATKEMLARVMPAEGDFLVVQEDGYEYLNPRDVFLRKYEALQFPPRFPPWERGH